MKLRLLIITCVLIIGGNGFAQSGPNIELHKNYGFSPSVLKTHQKIDSILKETPKSFWKKTNQIGLDVNGVSYENWNAGGTDAIASLLNVLVKRTYQKRNIRWNSDLIARYGINVQKKKKMEKTEDRLEINSTFGYRTDTLSHWFYSAKLNLKTQFDRGFDYPDRTTPISRFMAPGYLYSGLGAEFNKYGDTLALYFSPATHKSTWVMNQFLADRGDFGVEPAVRDENGNIIKHGKKFRSEFGILLTNELNIPIYENIHFSHRLSLYTDYMHDFGNIDIDWDAQLSFQVNDFVKAKISTALKYDDDIKTFSVNEDGEKIERGARVQWMQKIGIGLVWDI